jgi:hypothetical protein|tara:strand:- start:185 stop:382 length:198 start_codon:yes stop_codon:yes gene_type:complete
MNCSVCNTFTQQTDIKYWIENTEGTFIFCGAECSLQFHRKRNEKTDNNIEDFNNTNSHNTTSSSS